MENSVPSSRSGDSIPLPHWTCSPFCPQLRNSTRPCPPAGKRDMERKKRSFFRARVYRTNWKCSESCRYELQNNNSNISWEGKEELTLQHNSFLQSVICANASQKKKLHIRLQAAKRNARKLPGREVLGAAAFQSSSARQWGEAVLQLREGEKQGWCFGQVTFVFCFFFFSST